MRRILVLCAITAMAVTFCAAQNGGYLLINNDNVNGNSADIDIVSSTGALTLLTTVQTGGVGLGGGFFLAPRNAVSQNFKCFFVADTSSNDIAAFQIPSLKKVPINFTNPALNASVLGAGLAVSPNGKFLYSAWSGSGNIAVLAIAPDCSLTMLGTPISEPDEVVDITITKDGKVLVVSLPDLAGAQAYALNVNTGSMTSLGPELDFNAAIPACKTQVGCFPIEMDVDNSDQFWIFGNGTLSGPSILTAQLTTHGFINPQVLTFTGQTTLSNLEGPWLSPAARAGNGNLYLGAEGFGTGYPAGIMVANFNHGVVTYESAVVTSAAFYAGNVQTIGKTGTGSPIAQIWSDGSANNTVQSYTVNGNTLTPAFSLKTTSTGSFAFSITGVGR